MAKGTAAALEGGTRTCTRHLRDGDDDVLGPVDAAPISSGQGPGEAFVTPRSGP